MCTIDNDEKDSDLGDILYAIDLPDEFVSANLNAILHGEGHVCIPGGTFGGVREGPGERFIVIPKHSKMTIVVDPPKSNRDRQLSQTVTTSGSRRTLVVRVVGNNGKEQPGVTTTELMGAVFGLGPAPLENSMREQYQRCSFDQIDFVPAGSYPGVENGVLEITLPYTVKGRDGNEIQPDVVSRVERQFNGLSLHSNFEHVLFVLPYGTVRRGSPRWLAYATLSGWLSFYNSGYGYTLRNLMHEIGHNLGLGHSNEGREYGDETGMVSL